MKSMRRTKIAVTLGPASWNEKLVRGFIREGVDAFRFNFAHENYEVVKRVVRLIKDVGGKLHPALIGDLQGPVIRIGEIEDIPVRKGDVLYLVNSEKGDRESKLVPIPSQEAYEMIDEGDVILLESGRIALSAEEVGYDRIRCRALMDGIIKAHKTFAIKGKEIPLPALTEKDLRDVKFGVENGFDLISLSFTRDSEDVKRLREALYDMKGDDVGIVAKIETRRGVENLSEITAEADAVLVARGDLAIYFNLEEIPLIQRRIVEVTRKRGKPTIVATQLLESMIESPIPTRSEVVDVMRAVMDGVDALLLTTETAMGKYPLETVIWLKRIIKVAEERVERGSEEIRPENIYELLAKGVVTLSNSLKARIVAFTEYGNTARRLAKFRPQLLIHAYTGNPRVARQLRICWGVEPHLVSLNKKDPMILSKLSEAAVKDGILSYGDIAVFTAGMRPGTTDVVKVERILGEGLLEK